MIRLSLRYHLVIILTLCLSFSFVAGDAFSSMRVRGSMGLDSYGYNDENNDNNLWLLQKMRVSVYSSSNPLSFHFSGGYLGNNLDEFSASGSGRFLKGYLQYGKLTDDNRMKLGRFFQHRGVAVGVIDGLEVERRLTPYMKLALYAGLTGPKSREFEFADPGDAFSAGGELRLTKKDLWKLRATSMALSYTRQSRDGEVYRHRIGINGFGRINQNMNLYASVHLRPEGKLLRKAVGRFRYTSDKWNGMFEAGLISADVADYSWFSSFEENSYKRFRMSFYRYLIPKSWGGGLDATYLMAGKSGFNVGPVVTTPHGQIGYRISVGDHAASEGPWFNMQYVPCSGIETYAFGSMITYEWEAFDIASDDILNFHTGVKYTPSFRNDITLSCEFQLYQTPQFSRDQRMMGGIVWNFDRRMK